MLKLLEVFLYIAILILFLYVWLGHFQRSADSNYSMAGAQSLSENELYERLGTPDIVQQKNIGYEKYFSVPDGRVSGSFHCEKEVWFCEKFISPPSDFAYCILGSGRAIGHRRKLQETVVCDFK